MRWATILAATSALAALALLPSSAGARTTRPCGNLSDVPIHARDISCRTAYGPLVSSVVLGGKVYGGAQGAGWGTPHPKFIFNGGDPSGSISDVRWSSWGGSVAHGRGRNPIFKPRGGYYRRPVVALLKATDLGRCEGRRAYLRLLIREPRRPGGALGPWRSWAGPQTLCEPYGSALGG